MNHKKIDQWVKHYNVLIFISALALMIFAIVTWRFNQDASNLLELMAFPFSLIGTGLRNLSLTGGIGNIVSWLLFVLLGAGPLFLSYLLKKNKRKTSSVVLLFILGIFIYMLIYVNINPGVLSVFQPSTTPSSAGQVEIMLIILAMVFYYLLFSFFIMVMLESIETKAVISNLARLFVFVVGLTLIGIFYLRFHELLSGFKISTEFDNLIYGTRPVGDNFLAVLKFISAVIPGLYFLRTGKAALKLLSHLMDDFHTFENALMAKKVGDYAKDTVIAYVVSTLIFVFFQLIMAPTLSNVDVVLSLPILELFLSFSMLLLSRFFLDSSELKKENESFI